MKERMVIAVGIINFYDILNYIYTFKHFEV